MKRHRGLRRYYDRLSIANDFDRMKEFDFKNSKTWTENWHLHFDWRGYGNRSFKRREPRLDKLFRHFDLLISEIENQHNDLQLYAVLLDYNSSGDALFLHKPNANNSQFPFKTANLSKTTTLTNNPLNNYLDNLDDYEKMYGKANEAFCLLFKKSVGLPIE